MQPELNPEQSEFPSETNQETARQTNQVSEIPNFRFRLIPSLLLWSICLPMLLVEIFLFGSLVFAKLQYGWISPDEQRLRFFDNEVFSPPFIAGMIVSLPAALCGLVAALAWSRGQWKRALKSSMWFIMLAAIASYLGGR